MIIPSDDQWVAVGAIGDWFEHAPVGQQVFQLQGYAGTGKTTTIRLAIDALGIDPGRVAYAAYAMKAALVLRRQGLPATTIHKLIYTPVPPDLLAAEQARDAYERLLETPATCRRHCGRRAAGNWSAC
jgi:exodeoxyribonuclease-5